MVTASTLIGGGFAFMRPGVYHVSYSTLVTFGTTSLTWIQLTCDSTAHSAVRGKCSCIGTTGTDHYMDGGCVLTIKSDEVVGATNEVAFSLVVMLGADIAFQINHTSVLVTRLGDNTSVLGEDYY
jgi:hypothetical protein